MFHDSLRIIALLLFACFVKDANLVTDALNQTGKYIPWRFAIGIALLLVIRLVPFVDINIVHY